MESILHILCAVAVEMAALASSGGATFRFQHRSLPPGKALRAALLGETALGAAAAAAAGEEISWAPLCAAVCARDKRFASVLNKTMVLILGHGGGRQEGGRKWVGRRGIWIFAPRGGEELCALGGGKVGGTRPKKSL